MEFWGFWLRILAVVFFREPETGFFWNFSKISGFFHGIFWTLRILAQNFGNFENLGLGFWKSWLGIFGDLGLEFWEFWLGILGILGQNFGNLELKSWEFGNLGMFFFLENLGLDFLGIAQKFLDFSLKNFGILPQNFVKFHLRISAILPHSQFIFPPSGNPRFWRINSEPISTWGFSNNEIQNFPKP